MIEGEAIVGGGQCLAFTPCCKRPVRLEERWAEHAKIVRCPKNSAHRYRLEFVKRGAEWSAHWTLIPPYLDSRETKS